jgi:hypothetical protein
MTPSSRTRRPTALIAAVLVALVLVQSLGLLHRFAHAPRGPADVVSVSVSVAGTATAGWLKTLFAGHDQDGACDVYDQLAHADLLAGVAPVTLPAIEPMPPATPHHAWQIAAQAAGFLARGPPSLS